MQKKFSLAGRPFIELCNLLKVTHLCSNGAEAKHLIAEGKAKQNGQVELRKRAKIVKDSVIEYNGVTVTVTE